MHEDDKISPFRSYLPYISKLKSLADEVQSTPRWHSRVNAALDGHGSIELRRVASLDVRRKFGVFFTGTKLSNKLLAGISEIKPHTFFFDPTCGIGDLLVAAAKKLPLSITLQETLQQWGRHLGGTDLHPEFIDGARTRLVLLARKRLRSDEIVTLSPSKLFPHIKKGNGLQQTSLFQRATHILLNPPFGQTSSELDCTWSGGRITEAAKFVEIALDRSSDGTNILSILPDVLRSGSFSAEWRKRIQELAEIHSVKTHGIFDSVADVDVFLLNAIRRGKNANLGLHTWPEPKKTHSVRVSDLFDVHVGRVVPHRDAEHGDEHPYIHPRCVPAWTIMSDFTEQRRHKGVPYKTPFVVIRRTSRPGDTYRAVATVISCKKPVAVENHLIVCEPKDGKLETCRKLMANLQQPDVNKFLNARIRCRHLTVGVVGEIPFKFWI